MVLLQCSLHTPNEQLCSSLCVSISHACFSFMSVQIVCIFSKKAGMLVFLLLNFENFFYLLWICVLAGVWFPKIPVPVCGLLLSHFLSLSITLQFSFFSLFLSFGVFCLFVVVFVYLFVLGKVFCIEGCPQSHYVVEADFELLTLLT